MPKGCLVYNPTSGPYPSWILVKRAADRLRQAGWQIRLIRTRSQSHFQTIARRTVDAHYDALFIAGGDGSINLGVNSLRGSDTALGVLPAGTSNVWAQELGLPRLQWKNWLALEESSKKLARAPVRLVDTGLCNERSFLLWAGIGLDGLVVRKIMPGNRWQKTFAFWRYAATTIQAASEWHGSDLEVEIDGVGYNGHYIFAVLSNIHLYMGGLSQLSPNARLDDGWMELWLFQGDGLADVFRHFINLRTGRHVSSRLVNCVPFQKAVFRSASPLFVHLDGEPILSGTEAVIQVAPKAVRILVPDDTPRVLFSSIAS